MPFPALSAQFVPRMRSIPFDFAVKVLPAGPVLRACYAKSGTELAYGRHERVRRLPPLSCACA
eukprot:1320661-Rhodomonas_salina.2